LVVAAARCNLEGLARQQIGQTFGGQDKARQERLDTGWAACSIAILPVTHLTAFLRAIVIRSLQLMPSDTDPRIEAFVVEGYRRMSPSQKFDRVQALTKSVQELALIDVRRRFPSSNPREQALRVASRWLGPKLVRNAFGWDVDEAGY